MTQCSDEACTREEGHQGPHGYEAAPGLIIAPHGDGSLKLASTTTTAETKCGSCGSAMTLRLYIDSPGGEFRCQAETCEQHYIVKPNGSISSTLATLYPSNTVPGSKLWLEFVDFKCGGWYHDISLLQEVGIPTPQSEIDEIEQVRAKAIKEHEDALPKPSKTILSRLKTWLGANRV